MPKFLVKAQYTAEGLRGLQKDKAAAREKAVKAACTAAGGKLDAMYFALGDDDVVIVADLPSHIDACSIGVAVGATGMVRTQTVQLLTVTEMDKALSKGTKYRPPGG